jgi:hypothetical protein
MSEPNAICSFTCYELWTKQHIISAAGRGRKLIWPLYGLQCNKRSTICTEQNTSWWTDSRSAGKNFQTHSKDQSSISACTRGCNSAFPLSFRTPVCVTRSVNIQVTYLICRVYISKICIALVTLTITILITTPTSTNWWNCPTHSAVLASTITHQLPATNTAGCSLAPSMELPGWTT